MSFTNTGKIDEKIIGRKGEMGYTLTHLSAGGGSFITTHKGQMDYQKRVIGRVGLGQDGRVFLILLCIVDILDNIIIPSFKSLFKQFP